MLSRPSRLDGPLQAAAEAEEEEEGYGTESMTSASESSLAAGDDSEADSHDDPHQEHRAKVLGRTRLWAPAAACSSASSASASDMCLIGESIGHPLTGPSASFRSLSGFA